MVVHCVEIVASSDVSERKVRDKVADLKSSYGEKLSKDNAPFEKTQTIRGDTEYYKGVFRVSLSDKESEKRDLTEQVEKEIRKSASWWRVRWHECTNDGDTRTVQRTRELRDGSIETYTEEVRGCSWDYTNKSGTIPSGVA